MLYEAAIDRATYDQQKDALDEKIALAEMRLEDARLDEIDLDGILNFAQHLLKDVGRLWFEASTDQKQRLQQVIFPKGVEYLDGEFQTPEISLIFGIFHDAEGPNAGEASPSTASLNRTLTGFSLNQVVAWVREMDGLRRSLAA